MFVQNMKLRGKVRQELDGSLTFLGKLYDKTEFSLRIDDVNQIQLNENFRANKRIVDGWLFVLRNGKQGDRCAITLPFPTINFGKYITVDEYSLMPVNASINDFIKASISG